ncbi:hypothetical protein ROZALSC1DRAFT_20666 [Rozella allomycis CSF55]|uniref:MYND-type domain-containing protein n=1 Tax=Rozella allomycis (strain CSF55) TaxID=988480 RepID=A0A4P9YNF7_ROZAC|nr:hypothetical protein ROZALSC1DRAFT_20666 [Rozella allomycis CSF55]
MTSLENYGKFDKIQVSDSDNEEKNKKKEVNEGDVESEKSELESEVEEESSVFDDLFRNMNEKHFKSWMENITTNSGRLSDVKIRQQDKNTFIVEPVFQKKEQNKKNKKGNEKKNNESEAGAGKSVSENSASQFEVMEKRYKEKIRERRSDAKHRHCPDDLPTIYGYAPYLSSLDILPEEAYNEPPKDEYFEQLRKGNLFPQFGADRDSALPDGFCPSDDSDDDDPIMLPFFGISPKQVDNLQKIIANYALNKIQEEAANVSYDNVYYVLHIRICEIRPAIWRRVRVPAAISLSMLHDRILGPVLGWCRNYHSYLFALPSMMYKKKRKPHPKHDISFGPVRSLAVDMMHRLTRRGGSCMIDDSKVCLGDLLKHPGQYLKYIYDLGDCWKHIITLEEVIHNLPENQSAFSLLEGRRDCPPEDCGSMKAYCEKLYQFAHCKDQKYKDSIEALFTAKNRFHRISGSLDGSFPNINAFDPSYFDFEGTNEAMIRALRSKASQLEDSQFLHFPKDNQPGKPLRKGPSTKICTFCLKHESEVKKRGTKLKLCSRCRNVHYCSVECQKEDWNNHKRLCVDLASLVGLPIEDEPKPKHVTPEPQEPVNETVSTSKNKKKKKNNKKRK